MAVSTLYSSISSPYVVLITELNGYIFIINPNVVIHLLGSDELFGIKISVAWEKKY